MSRRTVATDFPVFAIIAAVILAYWLYSATARPLRIPGETRSAEISMSASPAPSAASTTPRVLLPILVYHIVRPNYPNDSAAVRALALTPGVFDAELAHLKDAGYHVVGFPDLEAYFASSTPLPRKPVVLSFDDGWYDQFRYAFPILEKHQDTATFFVFTNAVGRRKFLSWDDLRALVAAGMTIGDHTRSHPYLPQITDPQHLRDEIEGSKRLLENELGVPVTEFAYPFGQYNRALMALVKKAGFKSARADYWNGGVQSLDRLYALAALNAPTTTAAFDRQFP